MKRKLFCSVAAALFLCLIAGAAAACTNEKTYAVTYAANGGSGTAPVTEHYEAGKTFTVKADSTFTYEGYTFKAWNDGTKDVLAGTTYTMPERDVTFTAQWEPNVGLEGTWSGAELSSGDLWGGDDPVAVTATIVKDGEEAIDAVLGFTSDFSEAEGDPQLVTMRTFVRIPANEEGGYVSGETSVVFAEDKLTFRMDLGSGTPAEMVFEQWKPLGAAIEADGVWKADMDGTAYTLTFGSDASYTEQAPSAQPETVPVEVVSVGEFLVLLKKEGEAQGECVLVVEAGENGTLVGATGEGDRIVFSKQTAAS